MKKYQLTVKAYNHEFHIWMQFKEEARNEVTRTKDVRCRSNPEVLTRKCARCETRNNHQDGQALITLLFFMVIGIMITSAAAIILIANLTSTSDQEQGVTAYYIAQSGIENSLLRLIRNPSYTGETLSLNGGSVTTVITPGSPITITATGKFNSAIRKIQVQTVYTNYTYTIQSWKEIN